MKASIPCSNGATGPASQIPGLSQSANTAPVEKSKGRRVGIQATDSDYVKLAKQGGHKGEHSASSLLLCHLQLTLITARLSYERSHCDHSNTLTRPG